MSEIPITEIGAGGALAVVMVKLAYDFIKSVKNNNNVVTRNEFDKHKTAVQYKENCVQIVKRLDEANRQQELRFNSIDKQFDEVKSLIRKNGNGKRL